MRLALVTSRTLPHPDQDEPLLVSALKALEPAWDIEIPVWDDPAVDWTRYNAAIIRSTWDYVPKREAFVTWAKHVAQQTTLWNPAEVIAWNTNKRYLQEIERWGIPVVPTVWVSAGDTIDFAALMRAHGWDEIVVKPVVSAGGKDTHRVSSQNLAPLLPQLQTLVQARDVMIQPYFKSVETDGEFAFLFMNGQFSHAIRKVPANGEFLVHEHLGGSNCLFTPTAEQLAFAERILNALPWPTLYTRVDAMMDASGQLALGELEVTEPSMYLSFDPTSPARFAKTIYTCLQQQENMHRIIKMSVKNEKY